LEKLVPAPIVLSCRVCPAFPPYFPLSILINASRPLHNDLRAGNFYKANNVQDPSWISLICNQAADVRWNPNGLEAGGSSRAGPFLACMEVNWKEDMDESDEAKKTKRKCKSCTWVVHSSLFAQTFVPPNMATFTSSKPQTQTQTKANGLDSCRSSCV